MCRANTFQKNLVLDKKKQTNKKKHVQLHVQFASILSVPLWTDQELHAKEVAVHLHYWLSDLPAQPFMQTRRLAEFRFCTRVCIAKSLEKSRSNTADKLVKYRLRYPHALHSIGN